MELAQLLPGIVGAFFGAFGWLLVGVYIQRRQFLRMARNAARAVYFELDVNRLSIEVALAYGSFTPLARSSFERLLPELATLLQADELRTIVAAYLGHAGYQQVASDADLPAEMRTQALERLRDAHLVALDLLRHRAFSGAEATALAAAPPAATAEGA